MHKLIIAVGALMLLCGCNGDSFIPNASGQSATLTKAKAQRAIEQWVGTETDSKRPFEFM